ncbi:hypothetical protein MRX96_039421 [Rhipicephalus microplus]
MVTPRGLLEIWKTRGARLSVYVGGPLSGRRNWAGRGPGPARGAAGVGECRIWQRSSSRTTRAKVTARRSPRLVPPVAPSTDTMVTLWPPWAAHVSSLGGLPACINWSGNLLPGWRQSR